MHVTRIAAVLRDRAVMRIGPADNPETLDWLKALVLPILLDWISR